MVNSTFSGFVSPHPVKQKITKAERKKYFIATSKIAYGYIIFQRGVVFKKSLAVIKQKSYNHRSLCFYLRSLL